MARFNSSKLRAAVNNFNRAVSQYNSAARAHNARVRRLINDHNRAVRRYNDLVRTLNAQRHSVFVIRSVEWTQMTYVERTDLELQVRSRGIELQVVPDEDDDGFDAEG